MALSWRAIVISWVSCVACGPSLVGDDGGGGTDANDSSGSDDPSASASASATVASATATTASTNITVTATSADPSATDATVSASASMTATDPTFTASDSATATVTATDPTDTSDTSGSQPNGSPCFDDSECESAHCFITPLGNLCGECEFDSDCPDGGCTAPNLFADPQVGALCNSGEYGAGCMSDDACDPELHCALVIDIPGIVAVSTCGECEVDAQCDAGFVCAPDIAVVGTFTGVKRCVAEGSLVNGQSCDFTTSGDASCASGICAIADVMMVVLFGVCSECEADADCASQICEPPQVVLDMGFVPGACG